jgi:DNA-binding Lrp family transcriptional regulator
MDELDRRLLGRLREDSRTPTTVLARELKVSRATVQNRIDRLMADGVLLGFTVRLQPDSGEQRIRALASIEVQGAKSEAVLKGLRGLPAIEAAHTTNGRWDLVAELNTATLAEFSQALDALRTIDGVVATETSLLLKTYRF